MAAMNPHGDMPMPAAPPMRSGEHRQARLETVHFTVPKSWVRKAPKSPIHPGRICHPEGRRRQRGRPPHREPGPRSLEDNIARWKGQFGKKLDKENQETIDAGGIKITLVDLTGTFDDSRGMMGPTVTRPDYRMLGAIFQLPGEDGLHFVKCYGPTKTIAAQADEIKGFLRSLKVDK